MGVPPTNTLHNENGHRCSRRVAERMGRKHAQPGRFLPPVRQNSANTHIIAPNLRITRCRSTVGANNNLSRYAMTKQLSSNSASQCSISGLQLLWQLASRHLVFKHYTECTVVGWWLGGRCMLGFPAFRIWATRDIQLPCGGDLVVSNQAGPKPKIEGLQLKFKQQDARRKQNSRNPAIRREAWTARWEPRSVRRGGLSRSA